MQSETQAEKKRMRFPLRGVIITLVIALAIFLAAQAMVQSVKVVGASMEPCLHDGQYLVVSKAAYWFHPPHRGDIIVFHSPQNPDQDIIKRVIATPGETVEIKDGNVYIDGNPLEEPYIVEIPQGDLPPQYVPEDHYFVLGDNRNHSSDSRVWGMVPRGSIVGKAWICYWPPSNWQSVPNHSFDDD